MADYEYTVIPSPLRADKTKGSRTPADRFAAALAGVLNDLAAEGWEYVRAETLPSEERSGLTGRATVWHNVLVFRRAASGIGARHQEAPQPAPLAPPSEPVQPAAGAAASPAAPGER
ncbi:DUF4177 domain-containing protein [Paracoccus sp. S-4012]|uniref:DUF4177 domain-containing protein n=1 Tax=Paracoccus sp. S-4012 TaxID=2665648 RepID=UPI0012B0174F|nr:DUF4177 domain-containing protein [Paracoccus sp. S-4012]MRX49529.1 DUF4177 domain-containing protein [Paracoccus sp. S-4012]